MRKRLRGLFALLLPLLLLSGCWQEGPQEEIEDILPPFQEEEEPEEEEGAVLPERFALPYVPGQSLDPVDCADGVQQVAASLLYEGLFRLDGRFEPQPCLCISYTHDEAAGRYTFTLRSGVQFSDGSPLTGRDVKATLDRARTSARYASRLSGISSISANSDSVTISLTSPNTALPALLDVPIVKSGGQDTIAPMGTGPYFYVEEETGAYLIANQSWWRGENQPVERIALVGAPDSAAMLYRFSSHEVQLITADLTGVQAVSATERGQRGRGDHGAAICGLQHRPGASGQSVSPAGPVCGNRPAKRDGCLSLGTRQARRLSGAPVVAAVSGGSGDGFFSGRLRRRLDGERLCVRKSPDAVGQRGEQL